MILKKGLLNIDTCLSIILLLEKHREREGKGQSFRGRDREKGRESERESMRERDRERQRDRETERQRDRETER